MERIKSHKFVLKQLLIVLSFAFAATSYPMPVTQAEDDQAKVMDVLFIYSSGTPSEKISNIDGKEVDAVTTPTPLKENCRTITEKLASTLRDKKLVVRVAETSEIRDHSEILCTGLVVLGTPARFWNVSWELKKLFDEQFYMILKCEKDRLAKRRIAAFSMAEIVPSAEAALKAIKSMVTDCNGRFGPTTTFLTKHSREEISQRINQFADRLAALLRKNQSANSDFFVMPIP
jgi:hypothetical protein